MNEIFYDGSSYRTYGKLPATGSRAPDLSLVDTELCNVSLANYGENRKILNIFPSIDTTVCARSVVKFDRLGEATDDVALLMVSYDLPFAHARFQREHELEHVVGLSAIRHEGFGENYGVQIIEGPMKGMFGRAVVVLDEHNTVVHTEQIRDLDREPDYLAACVALGVDVDPEIFDD